MTDQSPESAAREAPDPRARRRRLKFALAAASVGIVAALLLLEVGLRVLNGLNLISTGMYESIPGVRYKLRPHQGWANAEGFNDPDRPFEKPPGVYRVVFLGDSYVWGRVGREYNFVRILERQLNEGGPFKRIEILNLGVPGYGPLDCLELWRNYAVDYQPDAVIFGLFYGNDFFDTQGTGRNITILGERVFQRSDPWIDRSYLYLFLNRKLRLLKFNLTHDVEDGEDFYTPEEKAEIMRRDLRILQVDFAERNARAVEGLRAITKQMDELARETGAAFMMVGYPPEVMVDRELFDRNIEALGLDPGEYRFDQGGRLMELAVGEGAIDRIDITPEIAEGQEREPLYIELDTHWNLAGNHVAAAAMGHEVGAFLSRNGLDFAGAYPKFDLDQALSDAARDRAISGFP